VIPLPEAQNRKKRRNLRIGGFALARIPGDLLAGLVEAAERILLAHSEKNCRSGRAAG